MRSPRTILWLLLLPLLMLGCVEDRIDKQYAKPDWLKGKIYENLKNDPSLSEFLKCVDRHPKFAQRLKTTGLYTIFAPNNEAFALFFQENPQYGGKVENMSYEEVKKLVEIHTLLNSYSIEQLISTDAGGLITPNSNRNTPSGFKKRSVFIDSIRTVDVIDPVSGEIWNQPIITSDPSLATSQRKVFTNQNKYVPFFYQGYMDYQELTSDDYAFYYNRPFEGGTNVFFAGSKIIKNDIPCENGFVHIVDRVVKPIPNIEEILMASGQGDNGHSEFLKLLRSFSYVAYNDALTRLQPGFDEGTAERIYNVSYFLPIDISYESRTASSISDVTSEYHTTAIAPTNKAYREIIGKITGGNYYKNESEIPFMVKLMLARNLLKSTITYKKDLNQGIISALGDSLKLNPAKITTKSFGSNGVVIGTDEPITPRAFESVAGPIYLRPEFNGYRSLIEASGVLPAITSKANRRTMFVISDNTFINDSSLLSGYSFSQVGPVSISYRFAFWDRRDGGLRLTIFPQRQITDFLLNMICEEEPKGLASVEYLRNLAGNYVIFDNVNKTVIGTEESTFGIGDSAITIVPQLLTDVVDNGRVYEVNGWLRFNSSKSLFNAIKEVTFEGTSSRFYDLLDKAGLLDKTNGLIKFVNDGQFYTVFAPSNSAIEEYEKSFGTTFKLDNNWSTKQLTDFLTYHFIEGKLIFTDGNLPTGDYKTMQVSKTSNALNTYYNTIKIATAPDFITLLDNQGNAMSIVRHIHNNVNITTYTSLQSGSGIGTDNTLYQPHYTSGVVHRINSVLVNEGN